MILLKYSNYYNKVHASTIRSFENGKTYSTVFKKTETCEELGNFRYYMMTAEMKKNVLPRMEKGYIPKAEICKMVRDKQNVQGNVNI